MRPASEIIVNPMLYLEFLCDTLVYFLISSSKKTRLLCDKALRCFSGNNSCLSWF